MFLIAKFNTSKLFLVGIKKHFFQENLKRGNDFDITAKIHIPEALVEKLKSFYGRINILI